MKNDDPFERYCEDHQISGALKVQLSKILQEDGFQGVHNMMRILGDEQELEEEKENLLSEIGNYNRIANNAHNIFHQNEIETVRKIASYLRKGSKERQGD
jgi:hypothetical protein